MDRSEITQSSRTRVRQIVIPVAGRGTRLLPATKAVPKALLPVGRKPLILHALEEAIASGAECVVVVSNREDSLLHEFFTGNSKLEEYLKRSGHEDEAASLKSMCGLISIVTVLQESPRGLADAIRCARPAMTDEPFGVILPDAMILGSRPAMSQLTECYSRHRGAVVASRVLQPAETERYGILVMDVEAAGAVVPSLRVRSMVEKPKPEAAPSLYGIFGRYILEADVFEAIDQIRPDSCGEVQLTDALNLYCANHDVFACLFEGVHFDVGEWLGFAEANVACMLADPRHGPAFLRYLRSLTSTCAPHVPNALV